MKISILAVTMEFDDNDDHRPERPPVSTPNPMTPDDLIAYLFQEACKSPNPEPPQHHGPFFKV